jgi:hypothetical protein
MCRMLSQEQKLIKRRYDLVSGLKIEEFLEELFLSQDNV